MTDTTKDAWEESVDCVGRTQLEAINNFIEKYILNPHSLLKKAVEFLEAYEKADQLQETAEEER